MKSWTLLTALCLLWRAAWASETVLTRIHDVLEPEAGETTYRVLSTADGRVYELEASRVQSLREIELAREVGTPLSLVIEGDEILEASPATEKSLEGFDDGEFGVQHFWPSDELNASYQPTRLESWTRARQLFNQLEWIRTSSQCYQRAHLWADQMYRNQGIRSLKVFLFFTRRYIRNYNYKWWFHVTPYVMVGDQEATLDRTFTDGPLTMKDWTDEFMHNKANCETIERYSDYSERQERADCYLRKVPMYYYQPLDIEQADRTGVRITGWRSWDLAHAARARCRFFCF